MMRIGSKHLEKVGQELHVCKEGFSHALEGSKLDANRVRMVIKSFKDFAVFDGKRVAERLLAVFQETEETGILRKIEGALALPSTQKIRNDALDGDFSDSEKLLAQKADKLRTIHMDKLTGNQRTGSIGFPQDRVDTGTNLWIAYSIPQHRSSQTAQFVIWVNMVLVMKVHSCEILLSHQDQTYHTSFNVVT